MNEIENVVRIIKDINMHHKHHFFSFDESDVILVFIKLEHEQTIPIKISKHGLEILREVDTSKYSNIVEISSKDLFKLINNKSYILRYITTGRVKIKGNIKKILNILQSL